MLTDAIMYDALLQKDTSFEGIFFAAIKTTGIFCRPSCTARKPKPENVEFFSTTREAIQHGYRPCKVCNPLANLDETPAYIREILDEIDTDPSRKFRDWDLTQKGIEPSRIRRWFLKNHGLTFQAYQRMTRINTAFQKIREGNTITSAAFDAGYESLSGFNETFKSIFGTSPTSGRKQTIINVTRIETPLGTMFAGANDEGICLLEFTDRRMLETNFKSLSRLLNAMILQGNNTHFDLLRTQLDEYFRGKRREFTVPIVAPGTLFQQKVWKELQNIPYGSTRSYKQQSAAINMPASVRAVANANGMNRIAIIIPCHRVIGEDGHLTGYGGGIWRKKWLIDLERVNRE